MSIFINKQRLLTDTDNILGRNYLLNTSQALSAKAIDKRGFILGKYQLSPSLDFNKKYIFRAILYSDKDGGRLFCGSYPNWSVYYYQDIKKGKNIISFPLQTVQESDGIIFSIDNCSAQLSLEEATLSEGTIIKEWQPASEDYAMKSDYDKLLGVGNLLTDDEMNIANALKSPAAQGAISNMNYSNGISHFHYKGIADYERINWAFKVSPNTNYRMEIVVNSTSEMTALGNDQPYMPWGINSEEDLTYATSGDIGNWHLPLPWSKEISGSITFNSGSYSKLYLFANFGLTQDEIDTDITLQIKLFKNDSIQTEIDQLKSQIEQLKQSK